MAKDSDFIDVKNLTDEQINAMGNKDKAVAPTKESKLETVLNILSTLGITTPEEISRVLSSSPEVDGKGRPISDTGLQKDISDGIRNLVNIVTNPEPPPSISEQIAGIEYRQYPTGIVDSIKNVIRSFGLKEGTAQLNKLANLNIDPDKVESISDLITPKNIIALGENIAPTDLKGNKTKTQFSELQEYFDKYGKLPSQFGLLASSLKPSSIKDGKAIYDVIDSKNQDKYFSPLEISGIGSMLQQRDEEIDRENLDSELDSIDNPGKPMNTGKMPIGQINFGDNYKTFNKPNEYLSGTKSLASGINDTFGLAHYGHYDENGEWQAGVPDVEGNYIAKDRYNWNRDKNSGIQEILNMLNNPSSIRKQEDVEGVLQTIGPPDREKEGQELRIKIPVYNNNPMGQMDLIDRRGLENSPGMPGMYWQPEAFGTDDQGPSSQNTGTADPTWGDYPSEDPGYYDEDIDFKGGGQISQGLDNLYMNKRDSKQKLHNMMGFQSRQYGGGLDDAYMNSRSAFANPNANTAFANPNDPSAFIPDRFPVSSNKAGGLPTIYRANGGDFDFMDSYNQADIDAAMADPTDDGLGGVGGDGGLPGGSPAPAPAAPQGGDANFNTSGFPTDPNAGVFGRPGQTFSQIKGRLDGDKPDDGYTEVEYTYLNDIMAKTGMTISKAENYLASMMATPGGIAAMEKGFYDGYTGGGPAGTLDNFARGVSDNLGIQEIFKRDKKNKEEEDLLRDQAQGIEPSIFNSIKDKVMTYFKGNKGLETEESKQEFQDMLSREGATFEPIQKNMTQTAFGIANSALNPLSPIASILEFLTGATPMGTVISKEGVRFALDTTGTLTPEAFLMNAEVDYGNEATPKRRRRPIEQKITETVTEEEKESTPKDNNSPQIKASNIDKLKSYMNLTRKDLSTSKKDLAITDISITEKDFT